VTHPTECIFYDSERCREDRYDLARLSLPPSTARVFARAFQGMMGAVRVSSRRQAWRNLIRFARFLTQQPEGVERTLADPNILVRYRADLSRDRVCAMTLSTRFHLVRRLLAWWAEDSGRPHPALFRGPAPQFQNQGKSATSRELAAEDLRRIASIRKREIDRIIQDFSVRERLERGEHVAPGELGGLRVSALHKLITLEAEGLFTQREVRAYAGPWAPAGTRWKKTPLRQVERYRALTIRTALPYYLLILIQTCGNPQGIKDLKIDCLQPHPTDPLKRRISWIKYRGHGEQAFDVLAEGRYSVARCVDDLLRLTRPIRSLTSLGDARVLMITRTGKLARRISLAGFHEALQEFRAEHALPAFTFADLRKGSAAAIDRSTGSTRAVTRALQHRRTGTSRHYLKARRSVDQRYERVLHFQGQMIALATSRVRQRGAPSTMGRYETVTGMLCRDPLAGVAKGSLAGETCLKWLECCHCPNAIIVKDDPAIVARIVRAVTSLREMREVAASSADAFQHFESAFRPTLHVIESQILPQISKKVRERAEQIAATLPAILFVE
jgi:hypothetical protein